MLRLPLPSSFGRAWSPETGQFADESRESQKDAGGIVDS